MTNDTNTLNGSLRQLGETMAANLTTQGVPSTYDEGLTTLAGKILQIAPPTPVPTTLKTYINGVEVDNTQELPANIISYADSEYIDYKFVVLDANNNPVQGYSIPLSGGGSAVSPTPVTDSNGEVSYRYVSGGVGDTNIYIDCTLVSKTYIIEDCIDYDNATSDKSSKYGSNISLRNNGTATLSYDANQYYKITISSDGEGFIPINSLTGLDDFVVEFDTQINYNEGFGSGFSIYASNSNWASVYQHQESLTHSKQVNGTFTYGSESVNNPSNTWLHYKITVTNNAVNIKLYNGDTLLKEYSETYSHIAFGNNIKYGFSTVWRRGRICPFKNLKIKPL